MCFIKRGHLGRGVWIWDGRDYEPSLRLVAYLGIGRVYDIKWVICRVYIARGGEGDGIIHGTTLQMNRVAAARELVWVRGRT